MNKILVSACLCGEACRYNGQAVPFAHPILEEWISQGRVIPFCPEILGGLAVPRPECQRKGDRVLAITGEDLTEAFRLGAAASVKLAKDTGASFCILKQRSPSCGTRIIHDGTFAGILVPGEGVAAEALKNAGCRLYSEEEIDLAKAEEDATDR